MTTFHPTTCDPLAKRARDFHLLFALVKRLDGRLAKPLPPRRQRFHATIYRDPMDVVARYLRCLHAARPWYRGGNHIARYHGGPGIAFCATWRNDQKRKIRPFLINA